MKSCAVLDKTEDVVRYLSSQISEWQKNNSCGLLLFLYSVLLTKVSVDILWFVSTNY